MREIAIDIIRQLTNAGFQAYLVGGAVRDMLLNLPVKDFDVATDAPVDEVVRVLGATAVPSRSGAPVAIVRGIEVASFRKDVGHRNEAVFEAGTMKDDAERRDFTVNALYWGLDGLVVDPTGFGQRHIELRWVEFIGKAEQRIEEDPTRILRAYRLAAQKGFMMLPHTRDAIRKQAHQLGRIAEEQKGRELLKLLSIPNGFQVALHLRMMQGDGVLEHVLPEVADLFGVEQNRYHLEGDAFEHTMRVVAHTSPDPVLRFAALLHDIGKKPTQARKGV